MAGDWIKMRVWLGRDPKCIGMADYLARQPTFMGPMGLGELATNPGAKTQMRNVTVALCVTGLLVTWGTAREQGDRDGDDLVLRHCNLNTLTAMTDLPHFGAAMQWVEWVEENANGSLTFPNFFKDNESPDDRHKRQNADRQAKHRAKVQAESNEDVTPISNVTVTHREEKRREEVKTLTTLSGKPDPKPLLREQAKDALQRLNRLAGRDFRDVPANLNPIVARLREGYTERDLRVVIATKCNEWNADEKMAEYLRPKTLFNRTNFASYAGQIPPLQEVSNGN